MMKKTWIAGIAAGALLMNLAVTGPALARSGSDRITNGSIRVDRQLETEFPAMAKISMEAAMAAALAVVPGKILSVDLDDEDGFLIYDIKIASDKTTVTEIKVDAGDSRILVTERERAGR